ncbi:flippase [Chitinophagaceae bacterium LB-8]|uniref:Flippase n=1 Tax=Paraflavisolibacter caeni TaxID=2982496 RepID=A0A9X3BGG4_9BACT|nr:flippase [Paraflavisolibacter caeni]MCU7550854.1 flippase [Paraflavisolibacter caeni]
MKLIKNIASLSLLQIANYILPFIILPYLTKVLGPNNFGKINFVLAVINYFLLFTDYGFNMSATQQVAIHKEDQKTLNKIFWTTNFSKAALAFISLIILMVLIFIIKELRKDALLYIIGFTVVLQSLFSPVWFFQGIEKTEWIIPLSLIPKFLAFPLIFIYVKDSNDYVATLVIQCLITFLLTAISCIWIFGKKNLVQWYQPSFFEIKKALHDGWHIFLSTAAINFYTTSNIIILGIFTNNQVVGYFVAADKLIKGVQALIFTIGQAAYPRINKYIMESKEKAATFLLLCIKWMGGVGIIASMLLFLLAKFIVHFLYGSTQYNPSVVLIQIMAFTPTIVSLGYVFGILGLLSFGFKTTYTKIYLMFGLFSLCLTIPLCYYFNMYGVSVSIVVTEFTIVSTMFYQLYKNKILSSSKNLIYN